MIELRSIFVANGVGVFILLLLLYSSRTKILRQREEDRVYLVMVIGVLLGCIVEATDYAIDGMLFPGARILNYGLNTYLYTFNIALSFFLVVFVDLGLYGDPQRIWKKYKPHLFIGLAMIAVNIVNYFVPVSFTISDQNVYSREPFSYFYYVVILYYCVTAILLARRFEKENGARAFFNVQVFIVPIIIGAGLQFMFYGLSMAWLAASIGLVGLFMMQQNEAAYIDSLVDTYNRQYLDYILGAWISRGISFHGAMIDIDRFKQINDRLGHSEGDRALKSLANLLKEARAGNEWIFRFAGDEFIVLKRTRYREDLEAYLEEVEERLAQTNAGDRQYQLEISYGMAFFDGGDVDAFMKEMDKEMYRMKSQHHEMRLVR